MTTLNTDSIIAFIDDMEAYLAEPAARNFQRWPILGSYVWPNNFVGDTYAQEMDYLRSWATDRLNWLDENMFGSCEDLGLSTSSLHPLRIYPNPTSGKTQLIFDHHIDNGQIEIYNTLGEKVMNSPFQNLSMTELDLEELSASLYIIKIYENGTLIAQEKIMRQ